MGKINQSINGRHILLFVLFISLFWVLGSDLLLPDRAQNDLLLLQKYLANTSQEIEQIEGEEQAAAWDTKTANLIYYNGDQPVFWINNLSFPPDNLRWLLDQKPGSFSLYESPSGQFMVWRLDTPKSNLGEKAYGMVQILVPYIDQDGSTSWTLPDEIGGYIHHEYEFASTGTPLSDPSGESLGKLEMKSNLVYNNWWYLLFACFLLLLLTFAAFLYKSVDKLFSSFNLGIRIGVDLTMAIALYISIYPIGNSLYKLAPYGLDINQAFFLGRLTVGGIIIGSLSLVGFQYRKQFAMPRSPKIGAFLAYSGLVWSMYGLLQLFELIVYKSGIDFYYPNVFHISPAAWIGIGNLLFLVFIAFLWNYRLLRSIVNYQLETRQRMLAFAASLLGILIPYLINGSIDSFIFFGISAFAIGSLFDQFVEARQRDLTWLVVWLIVFSGFTSMLLFAVHNQKPSTHETKVAEQLSKEIDNQVLDFFEEIKSDESYELTEDSLQIFAFQNSWRLSWNKHPYLPTYYDYEFQLDYNTQISEPILQSNDTKVEILLPTLGKILISKKEGTDQIWKFAPFSKPEYRGLADLERYHYAVYNYQGLRIDSDRETVFPDMIQETPNRFNRFTFENGRTVDIEYKNRDLVNPISLFSFLFTILFIGTLFLAWLDSIFNFLPIELRFSWSAQSSLGNRIQIYVLALTVASFLAIGGFTVIYFQKTERAEIVQQNKQRLEAVRTEMESTFQGAIPTGFQTNRVARSQGQEIRYFDLDGSLQVQSDGLIHRLGLSPSRSSWNILDNIQQGKKDYMLREERTGSKLYTVVYRASIGPDQKVRGVYGFPLPNARKTTEGQVAGFFGMLLNIYVFLLFIAAAVSFAVASSITQPITRLRNSLAQVKLGRNEPIPYTSKDELGVLISEYNQMLEKLEEATRKLSQSERESAWRQMAKQVAHEIKNPLTPMQLSIQHLQRILKTDPDAAGPYIQRTAETLVDQIETLSGIATAFSSFARMPKADLETLDVVDLLKSAHQLFAEEDESIVFHLELPEEALMVLADKNQLLRVFNNLYKNAIQAIPSGQQGSISGKAAVIDEGSIQITIQDNGIGIPEETRGKVFVPNFTTKSSGSGLGLAMARNIIQSFGGQIYFETEMGKGTSFFVELPPLSV